MDKTVLNNEPIWETNKQNINLVYYRKPDGKIWGKTRVNGIDFKFPLKEEAIMILINELAGSGVTFMEHEA